MVDEDGEPSERQPDTPRVGVAAEPVPVVDAVDGLEVGLHRARMVAEQSEETDQFPVDSRPMAFAYSENSPA